MNIKDLPHVDRILKAEYRRNAAPIARLSAFRTDAPFRVLVTTILSARTQDDTTIAAAERLFRRVRKIDDFRRLTEDGIRKLIYPVGFYRTKAKHLKQLPDALKDLFAGRIPDNVEDLIQLPGVGRKTANLVVTDAFDKPGICVDIHVHRISNRLGLVKTRTPTQTEMALRKLLPSKYWKTWNENLVAYGQTVCRPVNPHCDRCRIFRFCARKGVETKHTRTRGNS